MIEQILQADRYLQVDQVEKARDTYQKVVDLDPGNAIAVVGLARCALSDGEDQQAYELASRALEIDPENDMARRMEARLSEILATRGETVVRPDVAATPSTQEMRSVVTEEDEGRTEQAEEPAAETVADPPPAPAAKTTPEPAAEPTPEPAASTTEPPTTKAATEPAATAATAATGPPTSTSTSTSTSTKSKPPTPAKAKEPAVRKSLFDRLLGR